MTDTKLEPELPQEVPHDVAAAFFRERDKLNIIKDGTVAHLIAVGAVKDALSAIEADRNKRAPVGSLTDEQIIEEARRADLFNEYRTLIRFARALLSSVAPRVPEGFMLVGPGVVHAGGGSFDGFTKRQINAAQRLGSELRSTAPIAAAPQHE